MRLSTRKNSKNELVPVWRFPKTNCQKQVSIQSTNSFFTFRDRLGRASCNLGLRDMVLSVHIWLYSTCTMTKQWSKLVMLAKLSWIGSI